MGASKETEYDKYVIPFIIWIDFSVNLIFNDLSPKMIDWVKDEIIGSDYLLFGLKQVLMEIQVISQSNQTVPNLKNWSPIKIIKKQGSSLQEKPKCHSNIIWTIIIAIFGWFIKFDPIRDFCQFCDKNSDN